jgi:hypothetical protein
MERSNYKNDDAETAKSILKNMSENADALPKLLKQKLPQKPYGYVPFSFITKRLTNLKKKKSKSFKNLITAVLGFGFDILVYMVASIKMARGAGAGHW